MTQCRVILLALLLSTACTGGEAADPGQTGGQTLCSPAPATPGAMVHLPGGAFVKGAAPVYPEEAPSLTLHVPPLAVAAHEVTNDEFAAFVAATGYVTDAERSAASGEVGGGSALFIAPTRNAPGYWVLDAGASWRTPQGAGSTLEGKGRHPVVHVSLADARRYADWAQARLPSEIEWEYAAATGLRAPDDPLSGTVDADGKPIANIWHGLFPLDDTALDGFAGTAPVGCFPADANGVHDLIGNVWEWTETPADAGFHIIKGGSHLCAANFCRRYRPAAREDHETDFSASHIGFRIVRDLPPEAVPTP